MDVVTMVRKRPMLLGSALLSVVAALMLLLDDFAVWTQPYRYSGSGWYPVEAGWVYITEHPLYVLLFLALAASLLYAAWVSVQGLLAGDRPASRTSLRRGMWAAAAESLVSFLGGMVFLIVMAAEEPYDWWLDTGFYGGFIVGGLAALLLFLQSRAEGRARPAAALGPRGPGPGPGRAAPHARVRRPHAELTSTPVEPSTGRVCPACSAPARATDKFCLSCGTRLPPP